MGGDIPSADDYQRSLLVVVSALGLMLAGGFLSLRFLPKRSLGGLVLQTRLAGAMGAVGSRRQRSEYEEISPLGTAGSLKGVRGTTVTPLRPAGIALIGGRRVDVVTEGDFIPAGALVEVVLDEAYRRVVQAIESPDEAESADTG
jgi:membrane-bound ClpP family serine protease